MKPQRMISLLLLFVLVVAPLTVFAQGSGTTEWEQYTSDDGLLMFSYPKDWIVQADTTDVPFPAYSIANTQDAMDKIASPDNVPPASGDVGLIFMLLPTDLLTAMSVDVPADATPGDLALALVTAFTAPKKDTDPKPTLGKPEEVPLTDQTDAITVGRVSVTKKDAEGVFTIFTLKEGVIAVTYIATYPGEFTQELSDLGLAFAATITYDGTAQDLIDAAMNSQATPAVTPTAEAPTSALDGKALVNERCTVCHSASRIEAKMKSGAGLDAWTATVDRMISHGAQLNADERQAVLDYLTSGQ